MDNITNFFTSFGNMLSNPFGVRNVVHLKDDFVDNKKKNKNDNTFEIVKYIDNKELFSYYYDYDYGVKVGYITNKYVPDMKDVGCFTIMINSQLPGGPNGIFNLARSNRNNPGQVNKLVSSMGGANDSIDIEWNPMESPLIILKHRFSRNIVIYENKLRLGYDIRVLHP